MKCVRCGQQIISNTDKYCRVCGEKLIHLEHYETEHFNQPQSQTGLIVYSVMITIVSFFAIFTVPFSILTLVVTLLSYFILSKKRVFKGYNQNIFTLLKISIGLSITGVIFMIIVVLVGVLFAFL